MAPQREGTPAALTGSRPGPEPARTLDELSERLRGRRAWSGVSYRDLHRRVVRLRRERGIAELPAYATVYRCFQDGRSRLDLDILLDIVRVLAADDDGEADRWRRAYRLIAGEIDDSAVVAVTDALPEGAPGFAGRAFELAAVLSSLRADQTLSSTVVIFSIEGMAGVGKTTLAVHAAHRLAESSPLDLCLVVNLRGYDSELSPVDPSAVLDAFLRRLDVPGGEIQRLDLAARSARFRKLITGRRALLLLDNAATEDQVRPLLPDSPTCVVVVTSRRRLGRLPKACHVTLDVLSPDESVDLLAHRLGQERVEAEPQAIREIAELAGNLPLALAVTAARMDTQPEWSLADHRDRLVERRDARRLEDAVELAIAISYEALPPTHRQQFLLIALHPGRDLDAYAAAALGATGLDECVEILQELVDSHLLLSRSSGRYEMHDLVRVFAADRVRDEISPRIRRAALTRLFDFYLHCAALAMKRYGAPRPVPQVATSTPAIPDEAAADAWLGTERENLITTAVYAANEGWPDYASQLSTRLGRYFGAKGLLREVEILHTFASRATQGADRGHALLWLASTCSRQGRVDDAR